MPPDYFDELLGKVGPLITVADTVSFCNWPCRATRHLPTRKKLQGRRRGVEPNIEPSTDPEALRDAPRMGSNATRLTIQMQEAYCAFFNEEGAVPWQPRA
ncbi:unnamed protein product [Arctogadus glacialis]